MKISKYSKRLDRKNIILMIPFWHQNLKSFVGKKEKVLNRLKKQIPEDFGYIHYDFSVDLLNSDAELTKKNFLGFIREIIKDMKKLNKKKKREFYFYAQSLGGLFAMIIADKIKIKKMVLILPGNTLAESFWNGQATRNLKENMIKNGMTLNKLKKEWKIISPDNYFKSRARKTEYYILLTRKDMCIPYKNGLKLVKLLKNKKIKFKLETGNLPHHITLLKECLFPNKSLNYLINKT